MRTDTLYKILQDCVGKPDYHDAFKREIVGTIILTDYNNKTYRINDVDFEQSPKSKFPTKDGEISYIDYYKKRYDCNEFADWTREFRNNSMYKHVDIKRWYVITPSRNLREVQNFVQMCIRAANGMRMGIALKAYQQEHGMLPKKILFYRDGVGDGQLHQVFSTEVKFLIGRLNKMYSDYEKKPTICPLAFIVVSKRINTRYFINGRNPPPGTIVDDVVTCLECYDFFLVSQSVQQRTVSPTTYNIVYSNIRLITRSNAAFSIQNDPSVL